MPCPTGECEINTFLEQFGSLPEDQLFWTNNPGQQESSSQIRFLLFNSTVDYVANIACETMFLKYLFIYYENKDSIIISFLPIYSSFVCQ